MVGALFNGKDVNVVEVDAPHVSEPNDAVVRMRACGMCGTDLAILEGRHPAKPPVILGHECAGEVSDIGANVKSLSIGDHVVVDPNLRCGVCRYCRSERPNLCENLVSLGEDINGGFATYMLAPERAVYKIPKKMNWKTASLAEPFSCIVNGFLRARAKPSDTAVVYGAGPMGLFWVSLFRKAGARKIISVEIAAKRREAALKVGADVVVDPSSENPVKRVMEETGGLGADVGVEVIGKVETVEATIQSSANGGRVVIMGTCRPDALAKFSPFDIMRYEKDILGSHTQAASFRTAIEMLDSGFVPVDVIVTHEIPLKEIDTAFSLNKRGEAVKTVITM
jgi:(R,R)-butanediol dehydrogenase/meso-butanediol dehydrogenase/diacetyl reductase